MTGTGAVMRLLDKRGLEDVDAPLAEHLTENRGGPTTANRTAVALES